MSSMSRSAAAPIDNCTSTVITGVSNFETVVVRHPSHKFADLYVVSRNGERVSAAFENNSRGLAVAVNCYER